MFFTKLWQTAAHGGRWFFMNMTVIVAVVWSLRWYRIDGRLNAKTKTCSDVEKRNSCTGGVDVEENMHEVTTFPPAFWPLCLPDQLAGRPLLLLARVHCLHVTMGHICSPERTPPGHWWFRELAWCSKWALGFWSHFLTLYLFTERIRRLNRELGASQTLDSILCWFCLYRDSMFDLAKWIPPLSLSAEYLKSWL